MTNAAVASPLLRFSPGLRLKSEFDNLHQSFFEADRFGAYGTLCPAHNNNAMAHRSAPAGFLVLVVSAEATIRQTKTLLVERGGYKVVAAESRHRASEIVQQFDFDAVILDHTLDKRDRVRLVRLVRAMAPATRILMLHKSGADCGADLCFDSREGPEKIITSLQSFFN